MSHQKSRSLKSNVHHSLFTKKRSYLLATAAIALVAIALPSQASAQVNEWTGNVDNNYFNAGNWLNGIPNYTDVGYVNSGSAVADLDPDSPGPYFWVALGGVGTKSGETGTVTINLFPENHDSLGGSDDLLIGANGGHGTLTIDMTDATAEYSLHPQELHIGRGEGSVGYLNVVGAVKNTVPEGPIFTPDNIDQGVYVYSFASDMYIGSDQGSGTLTINNSVFATAEQQGQFIVGSGVASKGTVNVLSGGKLSNHYYAGSYDEDDPTLGRLTLGYDGGEGVLNIIGNEDGSRLNAPFAILGTGLVVGDGEGSLGTVNVLSSGKVHSFVQPSSLENNEDKTQADFDTIVGANGGRGIVTVDGLNAVWYQSGVMSEDTAYWDDPDAEAVTTTAGDFRVGETGQGELVIANQGQVRIGSATFSTVESTNGDTEGFDHQLIDYVADGVLHLGAQETGNGTLSIGGKTGEAATGAGVLMAKTIKFGEGEGKIRFNHTENDYVFDEFNGQYSDGPERPSSLEIEGKGTLEAVAGRTILNGEHLLFNGVFNASTGILQVNGDISSATGTIEKNGILEGIGRVGSVENYGRISPGRHSDASDVFSTLTIDGDYSGFGGAVMLNAALGADNSSTDKLVITGDTDGSSVVQVNNVWDYGAQTSEGIEVISVGGASNGEFILDGDYDYHGDQVVVGGAYAYRLYKGVNSDPVDGNWYLRSELMEDEPLYQGGAATYEVYSQFLLGLNGVSSLQQRVGSRFWNNAGNTMVSQGADAIENPYASAAEAGTALEKNGVWGRIEGSYAHVDPRGSTTDATYNYNSFRMEAGIDGMLTEIESGKLIGSVSAHYVRGEAKISSVHGDGKINTDGYGVSGALTWYDDNGLYIDGQAQLTWYDSDLTTPLNNITLVKGNNAFGYVFSAEAGKRIGLDQNWSIIPQVQLAYSNAKFSRFDDVFDAKVSSDRNASLESRFGLAFEHQNSWYAGNGKLVRASVFGIGNLHYEFLDGVSVDVSGATLSNNNDRLVGGVGLGGTYNWNDDKYSIYGQGTINTSLSNFGDSYGYKGNVGFRVKW